MAQKRMELLSVHRNLLTSPILCARNANRCAVSIVIAVALSNSKLFLLLQFQYIGCDEWFSTAATDTTKSPLFAAVAAAITAAATATTTQKQSKFSYSISAHKFVLSAAAAAAAPSVVSIIVHIIVVIRIWRWNASIDHIPWSIESAHNERQL